MFTGIIEEIGTVKSLELRGNSGQLIVAASKVLEGTKLGDSIAVNGVCLTVTKIMRDGFAADVMAETVRRTGFAGVSAGTKVNLERAMAADGRFGGHIVSGHIDGTGIIKSYEKEENAIWVTISTSDEILELITMKGSIAIDGISLTVAGLTDSSFQVSIIPHTTKETTLIGKRPGDIVNLENDMLGKYVKRLLEYRSTTVEQPHGTGSSLSMDMLRELDY